MLSSTGTVAFLACCHLLWNAPGVLGGKIPACKNPTITISSGAVVGTTTSVPSGAVKVNKYLGIPFAASPPQRFSPPQDAPAWPQPLEATAFKPACIQQFKYPEASRNFTMSLFNNPAPVESEDCLYLNVFTPSTPAPKSGRAVLFWIYGGNLQFGTAGLAAYDGSSFAANQDVVVVTTNYRTNVFGFPNSPELKAPNQNPGFLDQRKALSWVQANIAQFGGDPHKVTIFGESAGGYSVKQLFANPPSPLTFRAAIMESEASSFTGSGLASWQTLVTLLGCATAAPQIDCVRAAPATTIKDIIERNMLDFAPVEDYTTQSNDVAPEIIAHTAAQIPFLIGTNSQEGRLFAVGVNDVQAYLAAVLPGQSELQAAIAAQYSLDVFQTPYRAVAAIITDSVFTCPASALANLAVASGYQVWRYYFDAAFPNTQYFPDAGVYHASEITEVFGTYPTVGATAQQIALSSYIQGAWAAFAKNPQGGPGWPSLAAGGSVGDLGGNGSNGEFTINQLTIDYKCPVYAPIVAARGI